MLASQYAHSVRFTIEKLIYGGDGLARIPAVGDERRGKTVFVPYVLPGEEVEARVVEERKGFTRAELVEVLQPSAARITAPCEHFGVCGGCQYQHADYATQLEAKKQILQETILRGAKLELAQIEVHSGEPYGFRNRTRMKIVVEPEFALGYYRNGSHELEPVRHCAISSPLINRAIAMLWEQAAELKEYPALREVQFFANHDDSSLLVELFIHHTIAPSSLSKVTRLLRREMPEIAGVAIFASGGTEGDLEDGSIESSRRLSRAGVPHVEGSPSMIYKVGSYEYKVSVGAFFQTNRFLAEKLVELVTRNRSGHGALDLFAGAGLFTLPLARIFERVTAVEVAPQSFANLKENAPPHIRPINSTTEDYLKAARGRWDYVVVDPPRAGLGERVSRLLAGLRIPRIAYVSCDPATLSRDLALLLAEGYRVEEAHMVDLFPQTYHMESVFHLAR